MNRSALYQKLVNGPYWKFAGGYAAKMSNESWVGNARGAR